MQGEGDVSQSGNYQVNLANFIASIRQSFSSPNLPFVFGQISDQGGEGNSISGVQTAQQAVANTIANTAMVVTNDLPLRSTDPKDDPFSIHFNTAGQLALGERFARAYENLIGESARVPIPGLINTGMLAATTFSNTDQPSNRIASGAQDTPWSAQIGSGTSASTQVATTLGVSWINNMAGNTSSVTAYPNSNWITTASGAGGSPVAYSINFDLYGLNPASAVITGQFAAAAGTTVYLNGNSLNLLTLLGNTDWTPFSIQANTLPAGINFGSGTNTLTFIAPGTTDPQGLRVEFLDAVVLRQ